MRLKPSPSQYWHIGQVMGVLAIAVLCYSRALLWAPAVTETTNASLWACMTMATMSLVYFRQSP
jgi:hypothetical protein